MFANLSFDPKKEIGEILIIIVAVLLGIFTDISIWIIILLAFVLEVVYLFIYGEIEKRMEAKKPEPVKEEINFHEYDEDDQ